jgi:hypothetical protein
VEDQTIARPGRPIRSNAERFLAGGAVPIAGQAASGASSAGERAILHISSPPNVVHNNRPMAPKRRVLILARCTLAEKCNRRSNVGRDAVEPDLGRRSFLDGIGLRARGHRAEHACDHAIARHLAFLCYPHPLCRLAPAPSASLWQVGRVRDRHSANLDPLMFPIVRSGSTRRRRAEARDNNGSSGSTAKRVQGS